MSGFEPDILPKWTFKHNYTSVLILKKRKEREKDIFVPIWW